MKTITHNLSACCSYKLLAFLILCCMNFITNAQIIPCSQGEKCFRIPVVVHVIHLPTEAYGQGSNITDEQVTSQIDVFNEDFNAANADITNVIPEYQSIVADFQMTFNLVQTIRVASNAIISSIGTAQSISPKPAGTLNYLHIWVVYNYAIDADGQTCNIMGMIMPGTNCEAVDDNCNGSNGIIIEYNRFGKCHNTKTGFRNGRTMTHEVGHWLGLLHPNQHFKFGGFRDDCIADTPCCDGTTGGGNACTGPTYNCTDYNGVPHYNVVPQLQNYMFLKYNSSDCNLFFTKGQKAYAQCNLAYYHPEFIVNCGPPGSVKSLILNSGPCPLISIPSDPAPGPDPKEELLKVFPTPTKGVINYTLNTEWTGRVNVRIINSRGVEVYTGDLSKSAALLEGQISLTNFQDDVYSIQFISGANHIEKSFIVSN